MKPEVYVYDYESFPNLFTACFCNAETKEYQTFVVHAGGMDERYRLFKFLENKGLYTVGYNSKEYDSPVTSFLIKRKKYLLSISSEEFCKEIKDFSNLIINDQKERWKWKPIIRDLDLMAINHFNPRSVRSVSLKSLQFTLRLNKIMTSPYHFDHIVQESEIESIIEYNLSDVDSTLAFYESKIVQNLIKMRKAINKLYNGLDLLNEPNASVGELMILEELSKRLKVDREELKKRRTHRSKTELKDIIFPYIKFTDPILVKLLDELKNTTVHGSKGEYSKEILYGGILHTIGTGGLHSIDSRKKGKNTKAIPSIYRETEDYKLILVDVSSFYPNIAIKNKLYAAHLGPEFCEVYDQIYQTRKKYKYEGVKILDEAYKLALNSKIIICLN